WPGATSGSKSYAGRLARSGSVLYGRCWSATVSLLGRGKATIGYSRIRGCPTRWSWTRGDRSSCPCTYGTRSRRWTRAGRRRVANVADVDPRQIEEYLRQPYRMEIYWDDGYWAAEFPELTGLVAGHETWEGLQAAIEDAKRTYFEAALESGRPVPAPGTRRTE